LRRSLARHGGSAFLARRGISQRLLDRAESHLRESGCNRITLDTTEPLKRAIRFYERNGFCATRRTVDFFGMPLFEYEKRQ
jgi:ribosomal protein S18 acetylase RimI-like enzyme